jgi:hypothetical protein
MNLNLIRYGENRFDSYWNRGTVDNSIVHPFYSSLLRTFDHQILANNLVSDDSFVVTDEGDRVLALVPLYRCSIGEKIVYSSHDSHHLAPIIFGQENSHLHQTVLQKCFTHIDDLSKENNIYCHSIYYTAPTIVQGIYLYNPLVSYGYVDQSCAGLILSLDEDEEILWRNIRKSYRPLINKALRNNEVLVVDSDNYDFNLCEEYRRLHSIAAGRETRIKESFYQQYRLVECNQGYLVFIINNNQFLGAYFFYYLNECAFYASAATRPECDVQSGIGHLGLWRGIQKAKELGAHYMDFGKFLLDKADPKLANIEFFKLGFGGRKVVVFRGAKKF